MPAKHQVRISDALAALREQHGVFIGYWHFWNGIVTGRIPASKVGRQYRINPADLPAIAEVLRGKSVHGAA